VIDGAKLEKETLVLEAVAAALSQPSDVNAADLAGNTALHGAVSMGYDEVIRLLANNGAQINAKNKRGQTPLALALPQNNIGDAQISRASTVELLRKLGGTN
jgi:ankyrin repeat protein